MKIITIVGARPQFIKAAAVSRALKKHKINEVIVHTGQHFDTNMSDIFFDEMKIPKPDYNLAINGLGHGAMTGQMLEKIEEVLLKEKPDWVLVYGDTNSTLAGSLAASKLHIKVAHVEAGLRSHNMKMPEEINRVMTDRISNLLFCPTKESVSNLEREGYKTLDNMIELVGDVMYDAALFYSDLIKDELSGKSANEKILVTCHRAENTDDKTKLENIVEALNTLSEKYEIVFPLHPRTQNKLESFNLELNFKTIKPVGYFEMIKLINASSVVLTDSGGLQKEAYFFNTPCITMRDETEWVELVDHKVNVLTGANKERILLAIQEMIEIKEFPKSLYGEGDASDLIAKRILSYNE